MRKRHTPEQIAQALRAAEAGTPVAEIVRKLGVHENTFYLRKKKYGGLGTPEIRELRQLREENQKPDRVPRSGVRSIGNLAGDHGGKSIGLLVAQ